MSNYTAAIDLGTTKIVTVIGEKTDNGRFRILAYDEAESSGVRRGQVENIHNVINAIKPTLENVCENAGIDAIKDVYVGIAGQNISCKESRTDISRDNYGAIISEKEIKQLEENMYKMRMEPGEEVLHVIPQSYSVDDSFGIQDPVGRLGQRLSGNFHIIIGKSASIQHSALCIERLGLKLKKLILEPLASARAVLTEDEREVGVVVVDIGGGTTDMVIFHDGIVRHTAVIPFGGNSITEDIKKGCGILHRQAEQIKIRYGSCLASMVPENKIITVSGIAGREPREISFKTLAYIIEARMEEIIGMALFEIERSGYADKLPAGIVFTGGGAEINHLPQFIKLKTGMDVRIGKPEYVASNSAKDIAQPKYSTAVGLIMCGFDCDESHDYTTKINKIKRKKTKEDKIAETSNKDKDKDNKFKTLIDSFFGFFEENEEKV